ncbi:hypothetical protein [Maricaulis sp.]|uniref:hypothetical protein n=1 Tax=Maricaulis sp. TaxID=1486257 RepID=UPI000C4C719B|nr:hypothetical protein [Maricaulis sp.]MAC89913.1 hypothetical protein [Maricaulis sp.]
MSRGVGMIWAGVTLVLVAGALWAKVWPLPAVVSEGTASPAVERNGTRPEGWREALSRSLQPRLAPAPGATVREQPLAHYELVGVVEADTGGWGLFRGSDGLTTIQLGSSLDGYTLIALTPQVATFERGEVRVTLSRPQ